jgi:hypothetical protein
MAASKPKSASKKAAPKKAAAKPTPAPKAAAAPPAARAAPVAAASSVPYPDYPVIEQTPAILCLIVNILLLPGIGTIIAGAMGGRPMILKGILQLVLTIVIVGWVWSIISAVKIFKNANAAKVAA